MHEKWVSWKDLGDVGKNNLLRRRDQELLHVGKLFRTPSSHLQNFKPYLAIHSFLLDHTCICIQLACHVQYYTKLYGLSIRMLLQYCHQSMAINLYM